jgi:ribosomal protein S18 acetylase RimI-like enzyme
MGTNQTPHFPAEEYSNLRSGGSLKDGWSYLMPTDAHIVLNQEVAVAFSDEQIDDHVKEQTEALRALYLPGGGNTSGAVLAGSGLSVEELGEDDDSQNSGATISFFVKRGLQVVGYAKYNENTGKITEAIVRPSARNSKVGETLLRAIRSHSQKLGRSGSLYMTPTTAEDKKFFKGLGFEDADDVHQLDISGES